MISLQKSFCIPRVLLPAFSFHLLFEKVNRIESAFIPSEFGSHQQGDFVLSVLVNLQVRWRGQGWEIRP